MARALWEANGTGRGMRWGAWVDVCLCLWGEGGSSVRYYSSVARLRAVGSKWSKWEGRGRVGGDGMAYPCAGEDVVGGWDALGRGSHSRELWDTQRPTRHLSSYRYGIFMHPLLLNSRNLTPACALHIQMPHPRAARGEVLPNLLRTTTRHATALAILPRHPRRAQLPGSSHAPATRGTNPPP